MKKSCFLFTQSIVVTYIYPMGQGAKWDVYAKRFAQRLERFKPTIPFKLIVVANGKPPTKEARDLMDKFNPRWVEYNNEGWDIGAFQFVASFVDCDLLVCLGASTYFRAPGWLERMNEASLKRGMAIYGSMGSMGRPGYGTFPHLRTSAWWFHPQILRSYPTLVVRHDQRYPFEHGKNSIFQWAKSVGIAVWCVTYDGEYELEHCHRIKNGYHIGNQSNLLTGDRLTEPPFYPIP